MLAQAVNFLIVLGVLYKFLYKPLLKFLESRRQHIEASLLQAKRIEAELKEMEVRRQTAEIEAKKQAQEIITQAEKAAEARRQEVLNKLKVEAQQAMREAKQRFDAEKEEAMRQLRQEAARLVTQSVVKVIGKLPGAEVDKKLVAEAIAEIGKRRPRS